MVLLVCVFLALFPYPLEDFGGSNGGLVYYNEKDFLFPSPLKDVGGLTFVVDTLT